MSCIEQHGEIYQKQVRVDERCRVSGKKSEIIEELPELPDEDFEDDDEDEETKAKASFSIYCSF